MHLAGCDDILQKFPDGIHTVIGGKGIYLSGGEIQRLAIARAIVKDAPIIVLGEATAFADPENEVQIQQALKELTKKLGEKGIDSIILEGGGTLNASALKAGIVQKVQTYIAPKIFGGKGAPSPVEGHGIEQPNQAYLLESPQITYLGEDILLESELL